MEPQKKNLARRFWLPTTLVAVVATLAAVLGLRYIGQPTVLDYGKAGPYPIPALGVSANRPVAFEATLADMGRTSVQWALTYQNPGEPMNTELADAAVARGARHYVVTLEIRHSLHGIVTGDYDANIHQAARELRDWQARNPAVEVIVRPLHEANGDWYPWGFKDGHNGNDMSMFVPAWIHVWKVMKSAYPDLSFMWCVNALIGGQTSYTEWYPGDEYVDYLSEDAYNRSQQRGGNSWFDPRAVHETTLNALRQASPKKPIVIAETATSEPNSLAGLAGHTKAKWFMQFGQWIRLVATHYNMVAVLYFNYDKEEENGNDWRIYPSGKNDAEKSRTAFQEATAGLP